MVMPVPVPVVPVVPVLQTDCGLLNTSDMTYRSRHTER
jgi:hypothetical protein